MRARVVAWSLVGLLPLFTRMLAYLARTPLDALLRAVFGRLVVLFLLADLAAIFHLSRFLAHISARVRFGALETLELARPLFFVAHWALLLA